MSNTHHTKMLSADEAVASSSLTLSELNEAEKQGDIAAMITQDGTRHYDVTDLRQLIAELDGEDDDDDSDEGTTSTEEDFEL